MSDFDAAYNVVAFGAVGDGATDDTAAIQAAITAASVVPAKRRTVDERGQRVFFPSGKYLISSSLVIPSTTRGLIIEGAGNGVSGGATSSAQIIVTMTDGSSALNAQNSTGITVRGMQWLVSSSSYTGIILDFRGQPAGVANSAFFMIDKCVIGGFNGHTNATAAIGVDSSQNSTISGNNIFNTQVGILGKSSGSYQNQMTITGNQFVNNVVHIKNPGDAWAIVNNVFENTLNGGAGALTHDTGNLSTALQFSGNWLGDVTGGVGGTQVVWGGHSFNCSNNFFGFNTGAHAISIDDTNSDGVLISCNRFDAGSAAVTAMIWDNATTPGKAILQCNTFAQAMTQTSNLPAGSITQP